MLTIETQICWDRAIALVNSLPVSELHNMPPDMFMAVLSHAKTEYGNRPSAVPTGPNSLCANLRAVDERLRSACDARYMLPGSRSSMDEDMLQMVNF